MHLNYRGKLVHEFQTSGETRAQGVYPRHINGLQLSVDRFLLMLTSGSWRGSDDNRSKLYQIRANSYDGPLVREGVFRASVDDWDARGDGYVYVLETISPLGFGVPAGARIDGAVPAHAGLFTFLWQRCARRFDPDSGRLGIDDGSERNELVQDATCLVEWTQMRFDPQIDDLVELTPIQPLRQKGYAAGYPFCERQEVRRMITGMASPIPMDDSGTRWLAPHTVFCPDVEGVACVEFSYDRRSGLYEWTQTGPVSAPGLWEPSPVPLDDGSWAISCRIRPAYQLPGGAGIAWLRTDAPFDELPEPTYVEVPSAGLQIAFRCADGIIRITANDRRVRPGWPGMRNPLYIWDVDPDRGFSTSEPQVVFDAVDWKMPIRDEAAAIVDQAKVLTHTGGDRQIIAHRVRTFAIGYPEHAGVQANDDEKDAHGIYYSELVYDEPQPAAWQFDA